MSRRRRRVPRRRPRLWAASTAINLTSRHRRRLRARHRRRDRPAVLRRAHAVAVQDRRRARGGQRGRHDRMSAMGHDRLRGHRIHRLPGDRDRLGLQRCHHRRAPRRTAGRDFVRLGLAMHRALRIRERMAARSPAHSASPRRPTAQWWRSSRASGGTSTAPTRPRPTSRRWSACTRPRTGRRATSCVQAASRSAASPRATTPGRP